MNSVVLHPHFRSQTLSISHLPQTLQSRLSHNPFSTNLSLTLNDSISGFAHTKTRPHLSFLLTLELAPPSLNLNTKKPWFPEENWIRRLTFDGDSELNPLLFARFFPPSTKSSFASERLGFRLADFRVFSVCGRLQGFSSCFSLIPFSLFMFCS